MLHWRKIEKIKAHGRVETRKYTLVSARDPLLFELRWPGLKSIGKVEVTRTTNHQVEHSTRYFITSLNYEEIDMFMVRQAKLRQSSWTIQPRQRLATSLELNYR